MARSLKLPGASDRRSSGRSWVRPSELTLLVLAFLFYFFQPEWPALHFAHARIRAVIQDWVRGRISSLKNLISPRERLDEMQSRIQYLQEELDITQAELRTQTIQILENDALRSLFLLPSRSTYQYIHAEVVSWLVRRSEARMFVRISEPQKQSVSSDYMFGASVIAPSGSSWAAVGRVIKIHQSASSAPLGEIMLLSDPQSSIGVNSADTPSLGSALLVGKGLDRMDLNFAAHPLFMQALAPSTHLVTASESHFPPGLEVAVVKSGGDQGSLQVQPVVSFGEIRFVVILVPSQTSQMGPASPALSSP